MAVPTATAGALVSTWVTGASAENKMAEAPVSVILEVSDWRVQRLAIVFVLLAVNLFLWANNGRGGLQLGVTIF